MAAPLYTTASGLLYHAGKILVVTVGLPARGKTHISRALERYLRWSGIKTAVISLGDQRRKIIGGAQKLPPDYFTLGEKSAETIALRQKVLQSCEDQIFNFFDGGGQVIIYDANNGSKKARQETAEKFDKAGIHVIFLESVCDNEEIVEANIRSVKISSPDYRGWDPEKAVADYYHRITDHMKYYQSVEETNWPFVRVINVGEKIMINQIQGYLQSRIIFFLMNIHNKFRTIYFARSGQSLIEHSYKADSDLSPAGWEYAERLREFVLARWAKSLEQRGLNPADRRLVIWTSARRRAYHTAWPFIARAKSSDPPLNVKVREKQQMSEINPGVWDGLSPDEAREAYPDEWERFVKDPYAYRAPRAESYHDLCVRLEQVIVELEREQEDLLIIGHASVIRCLMAYLIGLTASEIPAVEVPRGDLIEVKTASYGVHCEAFHFWNGPGRSKPNNPLELTDEGLDNEDVGERVVDPTNFYENYAEDTKGKKKIDVTSPRLGRDM